MGYRNIIRLDFAEDQFIECTSDHRIYLTDVKTKTACRIKIGESVMTENGPLRLIRKTKTEKNVPVYDIIGVENGARFYANSILVSNCRPIIFEETLINAMHLADMGGIDPIERQGQVRWYKRPTKGNTYVIALDPSLGTGGDFAAIQVLELPSFHQVAEWQHNKTIIQNQIQIVIAIAKYIKEINGTINNTYYSVENNTLGEAALVSIAEVGEENIPGIFISEPSKPGQSRAHRKGFTTSNKSKLSVCAKFKQLVETKRIRIVSKTLISELKTFVASGASYAARTGDTDDLVMAMILAVRIMQALQNYDADIDSHMRGIEDSLVMPMPFIIL